MADNLTILEALNKTVLATKKYVDDNEPAKVLGESEIITIPAADIQSSLNAGGSTASIETRAIVEDYYQTFIDYTLTNYKNKEITVEFMNSIKKYMPKKEDENDIYSVSEECNDYIIYIVFGVGENDEPNPSKTLIMIYYFNEDTSLITDCVIKEREIRKLNNDFLENNVTIANSLTIGTSNLTDEEKGELSFSQGKNNIASGDYSHAEGLSTTASKTASHAEGSSTTASGAYSHAEGMSTTASGFVSHAEGSNTIASAMDSHAEGYNTKALSKYQHVQGRFNIEDATDTYAHIIGNGTSNTSRSNAHTLDWNGNAWYQGKLSQDGTPTEDKDLTTKKYVDDKTEILPVKNNYTVFEDAVPYLANPEANTYDAIKLEYYVFDSLQNEDMITSAIKYNLNVTFNNGTNDITTDLIIENVHDGNAFHSWDNFNLGINYYGTDHTIAIVIQDLDTDIPCSISKATLGYDVYSNLLQHYHIDNIPYGKILGVPSLLNDIANKKSFALQAKEYYKFYDNLFILDTNKINERLDENSGVKQNLISDKIIKVKQKDSEGIGFGQYITVDSSKDVYIAANAGADVIIKAYHPTTKELLGTLDYCETSIYKTLYINNYYLKKSTSIFLAFTVKDSTTDFYGNTYVNDLVVLHESSFLAKGEILTKTNTKEYTPTDSYHPATKKYVDDTKFSGDYNDLINAPVKEDAILLAEGTEADFTALLWDAKTLRLDRSLGLVEGDKYLIKIHDNTNDTDYEIFQQAFFDSDSNFCKIECSNEDGTFVLFIYDNCYASESEGIIYSEGKSNIAVMTDSESYAIELYSDNIIKKLGNRFLKDNVDIVNSITVGHRGGMIEVSSIESGEVIGKYSSAMGEYVSAPADRSHAEGYGTTAVGENSHAEGYSTTASGKNSHTEGYATIADGENSHAEGSGTEAYGEYSHAEGNNAVASGVSSHAEGEYASAVGTAAHAEGGVCKANSNYTHAEGFHTLASSQYQHVQGKFNIEDTTNTYAHIVGNGSWDSEGGRSNAHTLDWKGNAWYAGDVQANNVPHTIEKNIILQIPQSSITSTSYRAAFPIFEYDSNKRYIINYNNEEHELYQYPANLSAPNGETIKGPTLLCKLNSGKEIKIRLGSTTSGADDTKLCIEVGEIATTDLVLTEYSVKTLDNKYIPKHFESLLSISLGRKKGTTIGLYSSALGYDNQATNYYAHAEGLTTTASGEASHSEGNSTVASGENSHAEGCSAKATGSISHAEGYYTEASGSNSHAEGSNTKAIGMYSHSEGSGTKAKGKYSHAEGYSTIASGDHQHVQGKYNIEDTTNTYAHIVGNGSSSNRANIHTLDWSGNGWYAGKVTVGAAPTENMDVATKKYVDDARFSGDYNDLTNKPTIPSTEGLATETYVNNKVSGLVDSAPQTLDTLRELATALGNDPNFATTLSNQIGNKVDKVNGKGLSTNDLTDTLKSNYDTAYTHSQQAHAPSNAQKNSDITKAEIEAKLTGNISTHTHNQYLTEHQDLSGYALTTDLHSHTNKTVLDNITDAKVSNWNTAYAHSQSAHAPSNAQKNSDITKAEIEAKLTGDITTHTHSQYLTEHQDLSKYAPIDSPSFKTAISMTRKSNTTIGLQSVALGYNTTASGDNSHAEGEETTASGAASHTEGGYTTASGGASHAEGYFTIAASDFQHVQGKNNIEDTEGKYAHIVGNGVSSRNRSNAHTLDWNGNAVYAGKVTVGSDPTENMDVATKQYVDNSAADIEAVKAHVNDIDTFATFEVLEGYTYTASGDYKYCYDVDIPFTYFEDWTVDEDNYFYSDYKYSYTPAKVVFTFSDGTIKEAPMVPYGRGYQQLNIPAFMVDYDKCTDSEINGFYIELFGKGSGAPIRNCVALLSVPANCTSIKITTPIMLASRKYVDDAIASINNGSGSGGGTSPDYGPYSIRYNSTNNRLEFIYTPSN